MLPVNSLADITQSLDQTLGESTTYVPRPVLSTNAGLFVAGRPPEPEIEWKAVTRVQWSKIVGILFCSPASKLGKEEVLPNLEYFHHRSGAFVDFFCVGYGAYWPESHCPPETRVVAEIDSTKWLYSPRDFNATRAELERLASWKYSGESDLLLAVARKRHSEPAKLDLSTAIACNLEEMARDQAITSVRAFFEQIFRFGEKYKGSDPVFSLSDRMGTKAGANFIMEAVLGLLPETVKKSYKAAKHFAVRDVSR
jgi:hypothetical protein